jgi:hypothetical protein
MAVLHQAFGTRSQRAEPAADVIFVHGLGGDAFDTWKNVSESFDWPEWMAGEFPDRAVWRLGYPTHALSGTGMSYQDRAKNVLDCLLNQDLGHRPITFICHSLGGILVKQLLRAAEPNAHFSRIYRATRSIAFIATPHSGAAIASLLHWLRIGSTEACQLGIDDPALLDLNEWYRAAASANSIKTAAYAETRRTAGMLIVGRAHSDPGVPGCTVIPIEANHVSIAKPGGSFIQICESVARLVRETALFDRTNDLTTLPDLAQDHRQRFLSYGNSAGHLRSSGQPISLASVYVNRNHQEARVRSLFEAHVSSPAGGTWVSIQGPAGTGKTSLLWYLHNWFSLERNATVQPFAAQYVSETCADERALIQGFLETSPNRNCVVMIDTLDLIVGRGDKFLLAFLAWLRAREVFVITTCRPLEAQRLASVEIPDYIVPLGRYSPSEAEIAVRRYLDMGYQHLSPAQRASQQNDLWNLLDGRRKVQELSFDPLILRMIFEAYPPDPVPPEVNTAMIYTAYWERCVVRDRLKPSTGESERLREVLACRMGHAILFREAAVFDDAIRRTDVEAEWQDLEKPLGGFPWNAMESLLSSGVVEAAGGIGTVRFFHQTLLEFAAARHILQAPTAIQNACLDRMLTDLQQGVYFRMPVLVQMAIQDSQAGGRTWKQLLKLLLEIGSEIACYLTLEIFGKISEDGFCLGILEEWRVRHLLRLAESAVVAISYYPKPRIGFGLQVLETVIQTDAKHEVFALCEQRLATIDPAAVLSFLERCVPFAVDHQLADDDVRGHYKAALLTCFHSGCTDALRVLVPVFPHLNAGSQQGTFAGLAENVDEGCAGPVADFLIRVKGVLYGSRASEIIEGFLGLLSRLHTVAPDLARQVAAEVLNGGQPRRIDDHARLLGGIEGGVLRTAETVHRALSGITGADHLQRLTAAATLGLSDPSEHDRILDAFLSLDLPCLDRSIRSSLFEVAGNLSGAQSERLFRFITECPWPDNAMGKAWRKITGHLATVSQQRLKDWLWTRVEADQGLTRETAVGFSQLLKSSPSILTESEVSRVFQLVLKSDVNCRRIFAERAGAIACVAPDLASRIITEFTRRRHCEVWPSLAYSLRDCMAQNPDLVFVHLPRLVNSAVSKGDHGLFSRLLEALRLWPDDERPRLIRLLEDNLTAQVLAAFPQEKCQVEFLVLVKLIARCAPDRAFALLRRAIVTTDGTAAAAAMAAANIVAHTADETILAAVLDQMLQVAPLGHQRNARNAIHRGLRSIDEKLGRRRVIERFFAMYPTVGDTDAMKPLIRAIHNLESWTPEDKGRLLADTLHISGKIRSYVMTLE